MGLVERSKIKTDLYDLFRVYKTGREVIGYFSLTPNTKGCFEYNDLWYVYTVYTEENYVIRGPFNGREVIYAFALELGLSTEFETYNFSDDIEKTYNKIHCTDINEIM